MPSFEKSVSNLVGYAPALPTPFDEQNRIDVDGFRRLCELQIKSGATALVVSGTTGEAPNLDRQEHASLIDIAVDVARDRVPVIAGAGSNATEHAIDLTKDAEAHGADAILSVVPYYNRPTQTGLYAHFEAIARSTRLPIILYDVPCRTGCALANETIARLAKLPRIAGLKDASGDIARPASLRPLVGPDFRLFSGDDTTALGFIANGGDGCISVTSNVAPGICRSMYLAWRHAQSARATRLWRVLDQLTEALFRETNPSPVKFALGQLGLILPTVRLPLVELRQETKDEIRALLAWLPDEYGPLLIGGTSKRSDEEQHALALCVERDLV
jgi:4-hydroxy-tetrahydrodipicolinate synthase